MSKLQESQQLRNSRFDGRQGVPEDSEVVVLGEPLFIEGKDFRKWPGLGDVSVSSDQ
jgi:hypothetical protein